MRGRGERFTFFTLAAAMALLSACDRTDRQAIDTAVGDLARGADSLAGRAGGALGRTVYTNAELTGFINAVNDAEIEMGELARTKATDPQVREFAQRIITEHRALKTSVTSTAGTLGITPVVPEDDENLREDHREALQRLQGMSRGREFDEAFLEHEIAVHRKALDEVEDALGQANQPQQLRTLLEQARTGLQGHLTTAQELERKFDAT